MRRLLLLAALTLTATAHAQWTLQDSRTTADLRGIDNVGGGVAWASGTNGTVLRTEDAGFVWQRCTIPPNADHLDFRGIQAFDNNTAIVMSSGPGDQSRLYKTTDGCQSWHLIFTNPDKEGFFDALAIRKGGESFILGDPVLGKFKLFCQIGAQGTWSEGCSQDSFRAMKDEAAFAASNSSLLLIENKALCFVTGGSVSELICQHNGVYGRQGKIIAGNRYVTLPLMQSKSAGAFAVANADPKRFVAVGGDYLRPDDPAHTAAFTTDGGKTWTAATTPPHGYRSSVAYDPTTHTWLTVGSNGTDISTDDGRNWRPLRPNPNFPDTQPDEDQHWNALSLPFVVGPHGRIATLRPSALNPSNPPNPPNPSNPSKQ